MERFVFLFVQELVEEGDEPLFENPLPPGGEHVVVRDQPLGEVYKRALLRGSPFLDRGGLTPGFLLGQAGDPGVLELLGTLFRLDDCVEGVLHGLLSLRRTDDDRVVTVV
jgi:hypothetical protein